MKRLSGTILVYLLVGITTTVMCNSLNLRFQNLPISEQLPSNSVKRLFRDSNGFMWFGTRNGLCRYDGYSIKIIRSNWNTPSRLSNNVIRCIAEDSENLWVGTDEGLNLINKKSYQVKTLVVDEIKSSQVNTILVDRMRNVWVGTGNRGIYKFSPNGELIKRYYYDSKMRNSLPSDAVIHLYQDRQGRIWVSLWERGLCQYQPKTDNFYRYPKVGKRNNPFRVFQDNENHLWICTWGDGIYTIDSTKLSTNPLVPVHIEGYSGSKNGSSVFYGIVQDNNLGYIWAISLDGLYLLEKRGSNTCVAKGTTDLFEDPANKIFHDIYVDNSGNLWLGSEGEGVYKLDFNRGNIKNLALGDIKKTLGSTPNVTKFCETADGKLYTVINRVGIFVVDPVSGLSHMLRNSVIEDNNSITAISRIKSLHQIWIGTQGLNKIYTISDDSRAGASGSYLDINSAGDQLSSNIIEDSNGMVWLATSGAVYYKPFGQGFSKLNQTLYNTTIIKEDGSKNIWMVSDQGVFIYLRKKGIIKNVSLPSNGTKSFNCNNIQSVWCRANGDVYLGTKEGNLLFYNHKDEAVRDLSKEFGVVEDDILDIVEDNTGLLWLSTPRRIVRYNPTTHASSYFSTADGITVNSFSKDACIKLSTGQILFGGNRGIAIFSPLNTAVAVKAKQPIAITDIHVQNRSIFDLIEDEHYNPKDGTLTLHSSENNFGLEFSSLDFSSSQKIQYTYMLEGIDKDWIYVGNNRRLVNYANLPYGSYTFRVRACNENGAWDNQEASLHIIILPPFYRTWWAYLFYLGVVAGGLYLFFRNLANRIKLSNDLRISTIEKEKSEELTQMKLRYFTNISHELLTPLTIITLLIESLQKQGAENRQQLSMMMSNVVRLKRLIQQILAFKKSESGNLKLKVQEADIIAFIRSICFSNFQQLISEQEIRFNFDVDQECFMAFFDLDKIDKVIYNLLSNAFKYTPKGGEISVRIRFASRADSVMMVLSVSDSGSGIAPDDLPNVFKRFYTSNSADQSQSHGIGLSLTQDLIQLHKGHIRVNSELGEGAVFTFEIPVSKGAYTSEDMDVEQDALPSAEQVESVPVEVKSEAVEVTTDKELTILVAEDNAEINLIIVEHFSREFNVLSVDNGVAALSMIREHAVDLLISDVMMPEMDGLSLCQMIRNDISISHIAVLMLTAKNSTEDRVDCYNAGADAYISKPFEMSLLDARVRNLINKRRQNEVAFKSNLEVNISDMGYGSMDEEFLKESIDLVETHLADITFDFEAFAVKMGASKSTLYRKLKSLTGLSPGEFIRNIRLKHAAKQLLCNTGNISEIAYSVGFNDSKYFSRSFKAEFGVTPSEYRESQLKKDS